MQITSQVPCVPESLKPYVQMDGWGEVPVVLGHGFGTDKSAWDYLNPFFPKGFTYIRYDLAGCGSDEDTQHRYDVQRHSHLYGYADDLIELLDNLGVQSCIYVGHSVSCMIGAIAAIARPDLFRRHIWIGPSPYYLKDENYPGTLTLADLQAIYEAMVTNYQAWAAGFAPLMFGVKEEHQLADFSKTLFRLQPGIALRTLRMIFDSDTRSFVGKVQQPVHLIFNRNDFVVSQGVALWLHATLPHSTLDWIDAQGHLPHMTHPTAVGSLLKKYISI